MDGIGRSITPESSQRFAECDVHFHDQIHALSLEFKPVARALTNNQNNVASALAKLLVGFTVERHLYRSCCLRPGSLVRLAR
jgi:hypothetical protein